MSAIGNLINNVVRGVGGVVAGIFGGALNLNPSRMLGGCGVGPSALEASYAAQTLMNYGLKQLMHPNLRGYW